MLHARQREVSASLLPFYQKFYYSIRASMPDVPTLSAQQ
jgi:hypothetical protein